MAFLLNYQAQGASGKNEQTAQIPWRGAPEALWAGVGMTESKSKLLNPKTINSQTKIWMTGNGNANKKDNCSPDRFAKKKFFSRFCQ